MSSQSQRNPLLHTTEEWNAYKPHIESWYMKQNHPLEKVMKHMKQQYGFDASVKAYKRRFTSWEWEKNLTRPRVAAELRNRVTKSHVNTAKNGIRVASQDPYRVMTERSLRRYCERNKVDLQQFLKTDALWSGQQTNPRSSISPMLPPNIEAPTGLRAFESILFHYKAQLDYTFDNRPLESIIWVPPSPEAEGSHNFGRLITCGNAVILALNHDEAETALFYVCQFLGLFGKVSQNLLEAFIPCTVLLLHITSQSTFENTQIRRIIARGLAKTVQVNVATASPAQSIFVDLMNVEKRHFSDLYMNLQEAYLVFLENSLGSQDPSYISEKLALVQVKCWENQMSRVDIVRLIGEFDTDHGPKNVWSPYLLLCYTQILRKDISLDSIRAKIYRECIRRTESSWNQLQLSFDIRMRSRAHLGEYERWAGSLEKAVNVFEDGLAEIWYAEQNGYFDTTDHKMTHFKGLSFVAEEMGDLELAGHWMAQEYLLHCSQLKEDDTPYDITEPREGLK